MCVAIVALTERTGAITWSSRLEIAFSVVVLPAPLAPRSAVMPPFGTASDTPFSTRMT